MRLPPSGIFARIYIPSIPVPQVYDFDGGDTLIAVLFFAMYEATVS